MEDNTLKRNENREDINSRDSERNVNITDVPEKTADVTSAQVNEPVKKEKKKKLNLSDRMTLTPLGKIGLGINYFLLILWAVIILVPLAIMISAAFNGEQASTIILGGKYRFSLEHFRYLFEKTEFLKWVRNTMFVAISTMVLTVAMVSFTGYAYSRFRFKGRKASLLAIMLIQTIPAFAGILAYFTMHQVISGFIPFFSRQMLLVFIYSGGAIAGNTFLLKGYLDSISTELDDAARIDGCSNMEVYRLVIMPIARPMLAIIALWSFMAPFGDYLLPKILLNSSSDYTLAAGLFTLISDIRKMNEPAWAAGGFLTAVPIVILFMVLNRQLVSGLASGAVK